MLYMKTMFAIFILFNSTFSIQASVPWSTYHGGTDDDWGQSVAIDASGNVYITGTTYSTGMATSGAHQTTFGGSYDVFISKFNSSGVRQWTTYYGGSGLENGTGIALDVNGNIYIVGNTTSTSGIATSGSFQTNIVGSSDAFIVKFNSSGVRQWATYYGGNGSSGESFNGISIDANGSIIVSGLTSSTSGIASSGAYQTTYGGGSYDIFFARFNSSGVRQWATYYGSSGFDGAYAISNDATGNIFVSCITNSTSGVASSGAYQTTYGGGNNDILIIKFDSNGARQWGTYYGGTGDDEAYGIAIDTIGNILITGGTGTSSNMTSTGAHQTSYGGNGDAFVLKFNTNGTRLWATYFGGAQLEYGFGIATQLNGDFYITGQTYSSSGIATSGVYQTTFKGVSDAFVAKFNSSGVRQWSTYYGDTANDIGYGIVTDGSGNTFIAGLTASPIGVTTSGAFQTTYGGGGSDAFIAAFTNSGGLPIELLSFNLSKVYQNSVLKVFCDWQTASEFNNNYFSIERSRDGNYFEVIGELAGSGNSNMTIKYHFTDENPLFGNSYYRLRQTDFDGKNSVSSTKAIYVDYNVIPIVIVYENGLATVKLNSKANQNILIQVFTLNGTLLFESAKITNEGVSSFPVRYNLPFGLYLIRTCFNEKSQYFKVWVN